MDAPRTGERRRRSGVRWSTRLGLAALCLICTFAVHATLISLPAGEAEMRDFLPAAALASEQLSSALRAPSPVLALWTGAAWRFSGGRIWAVRASMLALSAAVLALSFLLAVELCGSLPGLPAIYAALLLFLSPLYYIQSLLAHPELPAMAALLAALYLFLRERHPWGAAAAAVAAFTVAAGAWVPLALGGWLSWEKRYRRAAPYLAAGAAAAAFWWSRGGEFGAGISASAFHTGRLMYFLFAGHGHWIALLGLISAWRMGLLDRRRWRVALLAAAGFAFLEALPGRMLPERALLPVVPLLYTAATAGLFVLPAGRRWLGYCGLAGLLAAGHFVNPLLWPFPYENNLTFAEDARLRARMASWLQTHSPQAEIFTAGPLAPALRDTRWGYVDTPLRVLALPGFEQASLDQAASAGAGVFVYYTAAWDPPANLLRRREFAWGAARFLGLRTPLDPETIETRLGLRRAAFLREGRLWAEIYTREGPPPLTAAP
jgi:hypothetical protein